MSPARTHWRLPHWLMLAAMIVVFDQGSKAWVLETLAAGTPVPLAPFLNLVLVFNSGAAFSFLANAGGWQRWFFVILATGVSAVIAVWIWRIRSESQTVLSAGLALVLGGAVGNLIDRILLGHVTDFIQVWFGSWAFPSFNVADFTKLSSGVWAPLIV